MSDETAAPTDLRECADRHWEMTESELAVSAADLTLRRWEQWEGYMHVLVAARWTPGRSMAAAMLNGFWPRYRTWSIEVGEATKFQGVGEMITAWQEETSLYGEEATAYILDGAAWLSEVEDETLEMLRWAGTRRHYHSGAKPYGSFGWRCLGDLRAISKWRTMMPRVGG